jgi:hypothetical protein
MQNIFSPYRVHQSILKKKFSTVAHIQNQYSIMTNVKEQISCQIDLFIDNNLLMYPSMHRRSSKLVLIAAVAYLVVFFALASGLFNSIIEGSRRGTSSFILPSRSVQTIGETIVTMMILFMGMVGAFLLYRSGKAITPKTQEGLLAAGFTVLMISLMIGFTLINFKGLG